jgi:hypothetical protein
MGNAGILPGNEASKAAVDALVQQLTAIAAARRTRAPGNANESGLDSRLLGAWELVYASNGTAVTRTEFAQVSAAA